MKIEHYAIDEVTLGGVVYLPGKKLPDHYNYQALIGIGAVVRKQIVVTKKPIIKSKTINIEKVKRSGKKRRNKNSR